MLEKLKQGIQKAIEKISKAGYIDKASVNAMITELQRGMLSSDIDVDMVFEISEKLKKRILNEKPKPGITIREHALKILYEELVYFLGKTKADIKLGKQKILLVGLFGAGKTSAASKLGLLFKKKGLSVGMIGCDVHRPAAAQQLKQLGDKINVPVFISSEKNAVSILEKGMREYDDKDVVIVDSAGRNAIDKELAEEIKSLKKVYNPGEIYLITQADIGQAAGDQAKKFNELVGITGIIVTKMDASAKAGGAISTCAKTGAPVVFIGTGETPDDLKIYDPEKFVSHLMGIPDLHGLLEKAKDVVDVESAENIIAGDFSIEDFCQQIESMQKMGPMSQILESVGINSSKIPKDMVKVHEEKMKKWKHIINSMTKKERKYPDVMDSSRMRRIAKGAGVSEADVRDMIANYRKSKKMIKQLSPGKLKRGGGNLGNLLKQFKL